MSAAPSTLGPVPIVKPISKTKPVSVVATPVPPTPPTPWWASGLSGTAATSGTTPPPSTLPQSHLDVFALKMQGVQIQDIANRVGKDRTTVYRWCKQVEAEAKEQLEAEAPINLITGLMLKYENLESGARRDLEAAKSDSAKTAHRAEVRRAVVCQQDLLLATGLVEKVPDRIYAAIANHRPAKPASEDAPIMIDRKEVIGQLLDKLQRSQML